MSKAGIILNVFSILLAIYSFVIFQHGDKVNGNYGIDFAIFVAVMASNVKGKDH